MTLDQLIDIVDEIYGDGLVGMYYENPKKNHGDTRAKFIALELKDTFDSGATNAQQLWEAQRVISSACDQLGELVDNLRDLTLTEQEKEEPCLESE